MADSDLPGLTALTGTDLADGDLLHVVDISDTTYAGDGTDKKIAASALLGQVRFPMARPVVSATRDFFWPGAIYGAWNQTLTLTANFIYYFPAIVTERLTLASIKTEVFTAQAASNIKIGIYLADDEWQPTTLIFDSGNISSATTGVKSFSNTSVLQPGLYLGAIHGSTTGVVLRTGGTATFMGAGVNGSTFGGGANIVRGAWQKNNGSFAALADPGVDWDTSTDDPGPAFNFPLVLDVTAIG